MQATARLAAAIVSALLLAVGVGLWHLATLPEAGVRFADPEYARLVGARKSAFPAPAEVGADGLAPGPVDVAQRLKPTPKVHFKTDISE